MISVYERVNFGDGKKSQVAFEVDGCYLIPGKDGCTQTHLNRRGEALCGCSKFLELGYCRELEIVDLIQNEDYRFTKREVPKAVIRDHNHDVTWVLTDKIWPVKNGTCTCMAFREHGQCEHTKLAKS